MSADVDVDAVRRAAREQAGRVTPGIADMPTYLAAQVHDRTHRAPLGPLRPGRGASGLVLHRGRELARWGDPTVVEMAFSATKTFLSLLAGCAFDDGRLRLDQPVHDAVGLPELAGDREITWRHLRQQTSGWRGTLWGKPSWAVQPAGKQRAATNGSRSKR